MLNGFAPKWRNVPKIDIETLAWQQVAMLFCEKKQHISKALPTRLHIHVVFFKHKAYARCQAHETLKVLTDFLRRNRITFLFILHLASYTPRADGVAWSKFSLGASRVVNHLAAWRRQGSASKSVVIVDVKWLRSWQRVPRGSSRITVARRFRPVTLNIGFIRDSFLATHTSH
jgi:hypothetical protein